MDTWKPPVPQERRVTVLDAGQLLLERLAGAGRKRATLEGYDCVLRVHLVPVFGERPLDRTTARDVEALIGLKPRKARRRRAFATSSRSCTRCTARPNAVATSRRTAR
jgi:hypothetical protein